MKFYYFFLLTILYALCAGVLLATPVHEMAVFNTPVLYGVLVVLIVLLLTVRVIVARGKLKRLGQTISSIHKATDAHGIAHLKVEGLEKIFEQPKPPS